MSVFMEGGQVYFDGGEIHNILLTTSTVGNTAIITSSIDMLDIYGNYQNITNAKTPINSHDVVIKEYVDNLDITYIDVTLTGTSGTLISNYLKGTHHIMISNLILNGPSAAFFITKNEAARECGKNRPIAAPGYGTGIQLDISWPPNEGIYLCKNGASYDGSYRVKISNCI